MMMISSYQGNRGKSWGREAFFPKLPSRRALLALIVITQGPRLDNALLSSVSIKCPEMQLHGKTSAISWFQMFHPENDGTYYVFSCTYVF